MSNDRLYFFNHKIITEHSFHTRQISIPWTPLLIILWPATSITEKTPFPSRIPYLLDGFISDSESAQDALVPCVRLGPRMYLPSESVFLPHSESFTYASLSGIWRLHLENLTGDGPSFTGRTAALYHYCHFKFYCRPARFRVFCSSFCQRGRGEGEEITV